MFQLFPCFDRFSWLSHGFIPRQEGIDVKTNRSEALVRLKNKHEEILELQGIGSKKMCISEQVHGNRVASVDQIDASILKPFPNADGLVTALEGLPLGVYVADCCAVFLVETQKRAIGLLHSGRKGTDANIVHEGISRLKERCGGKSSNIIAALSPCIHSCCYEVDFISEIKKQLQVEGVTEVWGHEDCTGCHLDRYYSYRKEKGQTGRMLAFMMIRSVL